MKEKQNEKSNKENKTKKKTYFKPEVTSYGSVVELTKASTGSKMEAAPGMGNMPA